MAFSISLLGEKRHFLPPLHKRSEMPPFVCLVSSEIPKTPRLFFCPPKTLPLSEPPKTQVQKTKKALYSLQTL